MVLVLFRSSRFRGVRDYVMFRMSVLALLASVFIVEPLMADDETYDESLAPFVVRVNDKAQIFTVNMHAVLPGKSFEIALENKDSVPQKPSHKGAQNSRARLTAAEGRADKTFEIIAGGKPVTINSEGFAHWTAPKAPGFYPVVVRRLSDDSAVSLQIFVMQPAKNVENDRLNGYRIGQYPAPLRGLASYKAPQGFIEVTAANRNVQVSPHFTLGQFLCKQQGGYPKYLVLQPKLLEKLELLLSDLNNAGIEANSLYVMSGYRTPFYNRAIGNVKNSRHIYGGAADVFVDAGGNSNMDDINGDGNVDIKDAEMLYEIADGLAHKHKKNDLIGGVGLYDSNAVHGPFVHVDVRGSRARWGHR